MRKLRPSALPKYLKRFPYLVYGVHVFDSQILTRLYPGTLYSRGDGTILWMITKDHQRVEWEFSDLATALEIQRNESHVQRVLSHLRDCPLPADLRARIRDSVITICLDVEQEIARPPQRPTLRTAYPTPSELTLS
jgi:hypothetical protein